jgi:hypothetical protein
MLFAAALFPFLIIMQSTSSMLHRSQSEPSLILEPLFLPPSLAFLRTLHLIPSQQDIAV